VEDFSDQVENPRTGNKVRFLKASDKNGCFFLNSGRCSIHEFRPVDCRLFPLDLKEIDGELSWVIYKYHHCNLSERDLSLLMDQISSATEILGGEVLDYATVPTMGMGHIGFKVLKEFLKPAANAKGSASA
jgi:hypothetical protein